MNKHLLKRDMAQSEALKAMPVFDVMTAARHLHDAASLYYCTPHYPELAAVKESRREIYEAAKARMLGALTDVH